MPSSLPKQLAKDVPAYVLSSDDMAGWAELNSALEEISRQSAILSIREWFENRPDWSAAFKMVLDNSQDIVMIYPVRDDKLSTEECVELQRLADMLYRHVNYHSWPVVNHALVLLNALSWDRRVLESSLASVLDKHTKLGGLPLFALVDAARLEGSTESTSTDKAHSRL